MDSVTIRQVDPDDAVGISEVLQDIAAAGKRTKPTDAVFAQARYVAHPDRVQCSVAQDKSGRILGFQSLIQAVDNNAYDVAVGWGIIGTHIRPSAARRGVGRDLFRATLNAAQVAGIPAIDATISATNAEGLAYYDAMGFLDYKWHSGAVSKKYVLR